VKSGGYWLAFEALVFSTLKEKFYEFAFGKIQNGVFLNAKG